MNHLEIKALLRRDPRPADTVAHLKNSPALAPVMDLLRKESPDLIAIPQLSYSLYREFERTGMRAGFEKPYFGRRTMLSRGVMEIVLGNLGFLDAVHDLLWAICEETSWVLPAHEEQGPDYWDLVPPVDRKATIGTSTALSRDPEAIDLFCAETGAALAEAIFLVGDLLAPEIVLRVRMEVERRIFRPYLSQARRHWWFKGALNWNGVCNGAIGMTFMRLCRDKAVCAQALELVLEGFEAYISKGFEPDGGSIEGIGYWNYGLMYYVVLAEHLHFATEGSIDLLADPRLVKISCYPFVMATMPGLYLAFGDATTDLALEPGTICRLADRTGTPGLRGLIVAPETQKAAGISNIRLAVVVGDILWWDGQYHAFPKAVFEDSHLPDCGIVKKTGKVGNVPVLLTAKAGHNDGHHSHTDVGSLTYTIGGENLIDDPGRALYWKGNFRRERYLSMFNNSFGHSVPRIDGQLQNPGPEFGGTQKFHGHILDHGQRQNWKFIELDLASAYDLPIKSAKRSLELDPTTGHLILVDQFSFEGDDLQVEEAIVSWFPIKTDGRTARIIGREWTAVLKIEEPSTVCWAVEEFPGESRANNREGILRRLSVLLPLGQKAFHIKLIPVKTGEGATL